MVVGDCEYEQDNAENFTKANKDHNKAAQTMLSIVDIVITKDWILKDPPSNVFFSTMNEYGCVYA